VRELQAIILCPLQSFEGLASGLEHFSLLSRPEVLCQDNDVAIEGLFQVVNSMRAATANDTTGPRILRFNVFMATEKDTAM
jgi:hypothetical protein